MTASKSYFRPSGVDVEHPKIRLWKTRLAMSGVDKMQVEIKRDRDGLTYRPTRLLVYFLSSDGRVVWEDETAWEVALEDWLLAQGARAISPTNEALRFALLFKPAFAKVVARYGDGYFNSVLVSTLRTGDLADHPGVVEMLRYVREASPSADSRAECEELIDYEIRRAAMRLLKLYDGNISKAAKILGDAVAQYLDDRFSVSNSRLLGLSE